MITPGIYRHVKDESLYAILDRVDVLTEFINKTMFPRSKEQTLWITYINENMRQDEPNKWSLIDIEDWIKI